MGNRNASSAISFGGHEKICNRILSLDNMVRFAGVIDDRGILVYHEYNRGITPLINNEELKLCAVQALLRMGTRQTFAHKTGNVLYSVTVYERVKRATIPLNNYYTLLVSFDIDADHDKFIVEEILPAIDKSLAA